MDLQATNYNNNDDSSRCTSKGDPQGGIRHRLQLHSPLPPEAKEEKKEQFGRKTEGNQVPHDSSFGDEGTNSFNCTAQLSDAWWMEEGSWSCFRIGEIGKEAVVKEPGLEPDRGKSNYLGDSRLVRVDPIVDFFTVDDELLGVFRIATGNLVLAHESCIRRTESRGGINRGQRQPQQAVIFKVKTTTPSCFRVRPIYGLVKPNVILWITVKSEQKLKAGQFLVEVCPVPGAIATMTNDLYTSRVRTNFYELESIWERVEQELKENRLQKELHRVVCRFQRSESAEKSVNNNAPNEDLQAQSLESFQLASEGAFPSVSSPEKKEECQEDQDIKESNKKDARDTFCFCFWCLCCCCKKCKCDSVRKLGYLSFMLAILLIIALIYIVYHDYSYYRLWYVGSSSSSNNKRNTNR